MAFNIFEGARRISLLLAGGAVVITSIAAFNNDPYVSARCSELSAPITKVGAAESRTMTVTLPDGTKIAGIPANMSKAEFVAILKNNGYDTTKFESKPEKRIISVEEMVALEKEDCAKKTSEEWRSQFAESMGYLAVGLAIFWALVWSIGWIVRGFLGIPRGLDKRQD